ncbi:MAG TPA: PLD nuclease N-terminal domain-containing protein, partial [Acidimicrobiales bacterium]|nr:PLD nuclease N-terminal domain-containing protein [Acidimicrobiales bacterium]
MSLLFGRGIVGVVLLAFWIWAILDVIATEERLIRNLPKFAWLMLVIFLSSIGALAWVLLGRPAGAGWRPGDTAPRPARRAYGPEDSPRWDPRL